MSEIKRLETHHHTMDGPDPRRRLDHMAQGVLGKPLDRPEGPLKVTGTAPYAAEWSAEEIGEAPVHGVFARATVAKGKVLSVDASAVESLPGVLAVIHHEQLLRNPAQGTAGEAPVQGVDEIAYFGQPIALVVAETFEQARHGAQALHIQVEAADDPAVDPEGEATRVDRPEKSRHSQGDLNGAMEDAAFTVDAVYTTPGHSSAAMEPHASIAAWDGDDLVLRGSYQMPKFNRLELADSLGIDKEHVRIVTPYVGGGFGSKLGISPEAVGAAVAARELGRPVKVVLTRPQVFETTMRRSETRQRLRLAADANGRLLGIGHASRVSNLPEEEFSEPVAQSTHFLYGGEHREIEHEVARVHQTCAGSVRAPGEAVGMLSLENAMDELAEATGIDPVELRLRNLPEKGPEQGVPFSSRRLAEALKEGAERFGWNRREAKPGKVRDGEWLMGMGVSSAARPHATRDSKARVRLGPGAEAVVETDMTDIGTGTYAVLGQIAGEMLGLDPKSIDVRLGDSAYPPTIGAGGSWGSGSSGSAVFLACEALRRELASRLGTDEGDLVLKDGRARIGDVEGQGLADLLRGEILEAEGHIEGGQAEENTHQAGYGAHFAEVAVSAVTGEVRIRRLLGVFAAGRILNQKTARSQCIGGIIFGAGSALFEELLMDPRYGNVVNHNLAEYHVPVNLDIPQIEVVFLEERDDWANVLQAKGLGELGICGAGAAVTNAVYNATGVRVREYPVTLDKIFPHLPED